MNLALTSRDKQPNSRLMRWLLWTVIVLLALLLVFWVLWHRIDSRLAAYGAQEQTLQSAVKAMNRSAVSKGWVADYVNHQAITPAQLDSDEAAMQQWVDNKLTAALNQSRRTVVTQSVITSPAATAPAAVNRVGSQTANNTTTVIASNSTGATDDYQAGPGLSLDAGTIELDPTHANDWAALQTFSGGLELAGVSYSSLAGTGLTHANGVLATTLGDMIETSELADGSVTAAKLAPGSITWSMLGSNGCSPGQTVRWSGAAWTCVTPAAGGNGATYGAGDGLILQAGNFSLDMSRANNWSGRQDFAAGLRLNGADINSVTGNGLILQNGVLSSRLGNSISSIELDDGAVTAAKLADGAVSTAKLAQSGCTVGNVLKWQSAGWVCAADQDTDTNTTYAFGGGLQLDSGNNTVSLDMTASHAWTAVQAFNGFAVGGKTYNDLAGTGLMLNNGVLSSVLGTTIDTAEIANGAVTFDKLASNGCASQQLLKWSGTAWVCGTESAGTSYSAGAGLGLSAGVFSLDLSKPNSWSGLQAFGGGFSIGGNAYTNLAGSGLAFNGGTLNSSLGNSIETAELADGAVTSSKILDGTIATADLADGIVTSAKIADGTVTSADLATGAVTASQLADGAVSAAKLSTAARKRVVTVAVPSILASLLSVQEQAMFIAPTNGTVTKVTFTSGNTVVAASNQGTISVERKTSPAATVASLNLSSIGLTVMTPASPTLNAGTTFNAGDVYSFKYAPGVVGVSLNNMLVTIEYTVSD